MRRLPCLLLCLPLFVGCGGGDSDVDGRNSDEARRLRNRALAFLDSDRQPQAAEVLTQLAPLVGDDPLVPANRALIALRSGDPTEAARLVDIAMAAAPGDGVIARLAARIAWNEGDFERGIEILDHAAAADGDDLKVRWALAESLRSSGRVEDQAIHLEAIVESAPDNLLARLALARVLLELERGPDAESQLAWIAGSGLIDDADAIPLLRGALEQLEADNLNAARGAAIALNNLLKPTRAWQHSNSQLAGPPGPAGEPVRYFRGEMSVPLAPPAPIEISWATGDVTPLEADLAVLARDGGETAAVARANGNRLSWAGHRLILGAPIASLVPIDWDNDASVDLAVATANGAVYLDMHTGDSPALLREATGDLPTLMVPWDYDQEGDLDLLVGWLDRPALVLRNNGDGTVTSRRLPGAPILHEAVVVDLDDDGARDLVAIDGDGDLVMLRNFRAAKLVPELLLAGPGASSLVAADLGNDGWFDLVWASDDGHLVIATNNGAGGLDLSSTPTLGAIGEVHALDADNDGWLDLLAVVDGSLRLLRNAGGLSFVEQPIEDPPGDIDGLQVTDIDLDGDLDLLIVADGHVVPWFHAGTPGRGWQIVALRAILAGGQRNPSSGHGGLVEVRAGAHYQKRTIDGPYVHLGLGVHGPADVVRVTWPNGVPQERVSPDENALFLEEQILKGSCPYLAVVGAQGMSFVTDLLWRSPLGMKVNAQTVPPIAATRDWVLVPGAMVEERDGRCTAFITASLWETHFVDEASMIAVDHPPDVTVLVDERFVAPQPPAYRLYALRNLRPPLQAIDDRGRDVLAALRDRDGLRVGDFEMGRYQGVAAEHYVELDLGPLLSDDQVFLVASGWIRPTDTSINVASAQGQSPPPRPLAVQVPDGSGGWVDAIANAGFPAGKRKTIVLELDATLFPAGDHRVRLVTNLEIYWDRIVFCVDEVDTPTQRPLDLVAADLHYLGFPEMERSDADAPWLPNYDQLDPSPRWRDLEGYYTRFGDVTPLLATIDDRYVIMNAGDAIALSFETGAPPPKGWVRDYVFFSDGWVKDGDWNTVASQSVGPLPFHDMEGYPYDPATLPATLRRSHEDWQDYHTRYIWQDAFRRRLR